MRIRKELESLLTVENAFWLFLVIGSVYCSFSVGNYLARRNEIRVDQSLKLARINRPLRMQLDKALERASFFSFSYEILYAYCEEYFYKSDREKQQLETMNRIILRDGLQKSRFEGDYATLKNFYERAENIMKYKIICALDEAGKHYRYELIDFDNLMYSKERIGQYWKEAFDSVFILLTDQGKFNQSDFMKKFEKHFENEKKNFEKAIVKLKEMKVLS